MASCATSATPARASTTRRSWRRGGGSTPSGLTRALPRASGRRPRSRAGRSRSSRATLIRMPDGVNGQRFYQKHPDGSAPEFVETVVGYSDHIVGDVTMILCQNVASLIWLGQMGALELHSSYSRIVPEPEGVNATQDFAGSLENVKGSILNYPDFVVFDLDPVRPDEKSAPA